MDDDDDEAGGSISVPPDGTAARTSIENAKKSRKKRRSVGYGWGLRCMDARTSCFTPSPPNASLSMKLHYRHTCRAPNK